MKINTALKTLLFTTLTLFLGFFVFSKIVSAQTIEEQSFDVEVTANIDVDLHSQLSLIPISVEIFQPATVDIRVITSNGIPRSGRNIVIYVQGDSSGISITQPAPTNASGRTSGTVSSSQPGSYVICAKDVTEGYDIFIEDCKTLYVTPVPVPNMLPEPEYTRGDSNTVMWNTPGSGVYEYYAQVSTESDFSSIKDSSGWVSNFAYEFTDLESGQMYFYRVRARNAYGGMSGWSNVVFSVQDAEAPEIVLISISDIGENTNVNWDRNFTINIRYRITDNVEVSTRDFWCVGNDQIRYDCIHTVTEDGDFWDISIQLKNLEKTPTGNLFSQYEFCVEATDSVNNVSRNCEAKLDIVIEVPEEEIPPPVIPRVPLITRIAERLEKVFDDTLLRFREADLTEVTITTTAANVMIGFGLLLTALGYIPNFLMQLIIGLLSLLGIRKKGKESGYVYDSVTKEPISQAIVRVFNEVHELVWTSVTDSNGYFKTINMEDAEYYIKVTARNYTFPSKVVFGKTDFPLENVYHGDPFLTREEKIPMFSIPMDSEEVGDFRKNVTKFFSRTKALWRVVHVILFIFGLSLSMYATFVNPFWWNYLMLGLYVPALFALIYSFHGKKVKYGVVMDTEKNEVKGAIVGLNEKEFGKLVSKRITDAFGRYRFLVSGGRYSLSVLNSDLKIVNEEEFSDLIAEDGGQVLAPKIIVKRLEDDVEDEEIMEPLDEL